MTTEDVTIGIPNPLSPDSIPIILIPDGPSAYISITDLSIIGCYERGNYIVPDTEGGIAFLDEGFTYDGVQAIMKKYFSLEKIEIKGCNTCFIGEGCLNFNINNFLFGGNYFGDNNNIPYPNPALLESSNYGIDLKRYVYNEEGGAISANAINISNGDISFCYKIGLQFEGGNLLSLNEVTFEQNGDLVNGSLDTGAIFIKPLLNDYGNDGNFVSIFNFNSCWFEINGGYSINLIAPDDEAEYKQNIIVNMNGCFFASQNFPINSGVRLFLIPSDTYASNISKVNIIGCASKAPEFFIKAKQSVIIGSYITNLNITNPTNYVSTPSTINLNDIMLGS